MINTTSIIDSLHENQVVLESFYNQVNQFAKTSLYLQIFRHQEEIKERLKAAFGAKAYLQIYQCISILKDMKIIAELDLYNVYKCLVENIDNESKLKEFLLVMYQSNCTPDFLAAGLYSESDEAAQMNVKLIE